MPARRVLGCYRQNSLASTGKALEQHNDAGQMRTICLPRVFPAILVASNVASRPDFLDRVLALGLIEFGALAKTH